VPRRCGIFIFLHDCFDLGIYECMCVYRSACIINNSTGCTPDIRVENQPTRPVYRGTTCSEIIIIFTGAAAKTLKPAIFLLLFSRFCSWLNALDDLADVSVALNSSADNRKVFGSGSCSALIKLLPENKDLLVSHVTWSG